MKFLGLSDERLPRTRQHLVNGHTEDDNVNRILDEIVTGMIESPLNFSLVEVGDLHLWAMSLFLTLYCKEHYGLGIYNR